MGILTWEFQDATINCMLFGVVVNICFVSYSVPNLRKQKGKNQSLAFLVLLLPQPQAEQQKQSSKLYLPLFILLLETGPIPPPTDRPRILSNQQS